jgi:hypothetical protein
MNAYLSADGSILLPAASASVVCPLLNLGCCATFTVWKAGEQ